jgi:hypothetical protein
MITLLLIVVAFAGGFYAGLKNAKSAKVDQAFCSPSTTASSPSTPRRHPPTSPRW